MAKRKQEKFAALGTYPNVLQQVHFKHPFLTDASGQEVNYRGRWSRAFFKNDNPLILELACGKGEYTVQMAAAMPGTNCIGIDIKGNRIYTGARSALEEQIANAAFVRTEITHLPLFFDTGEISEIWITFPDPHLKPSKDQQRLSSVRFLNIYKQVLQPGALLHLKTDDPTLYDFTLQTIRETNSRLHAAGEDIYSQPLIHPFLNIKTYYEKMHLEAGKKIKYVQWSL